MAVADRSINRPSFCWAGDVLFSKNLSLLAQSGRKYLIFLQILAAGRLTYSVLVFTLAERQLPLLRHLPDHLQEPRVRAGPRHAARPGWAERGGQVDAAEAHLWGAGESRFESIFYKIYCVFCVKVHAVDEIFHSYPGL